MRKHKAAGPDEIPIEFYKWAHGDNLILVPHTLNNWWSTGTFPADKFKAHTASIYKKGYPEN